MTFQQKNVSVSLASFSLILLFFLLRILQLTRNENFTEPPVFRLWGITIVLAILMTIGGTILTHIIFAILEAIRTGSETPDIEDVTDERDKLIDLRGSKISYNASSAGVIAAMLAFVMGQSALVMFTLLIFSGIFAQIVGDFSRLQMYRRGL